MFRKSRLAIFGFTFFFFLTGALTANCLEDSGRPWNQSEVGNAGDRKSRSDTESLHCPDDLKVYATGQPAKLSKHKSNVKQATDGIAVSSSIAAAHPFAPRISILASPSPFPYRLIPVYQFNVVYRI